MNDEPEMLRVKYKFYKSTWLHSSPPRLQTAKLHPCSTTSNPHQAAKMAQPQQKDNRTVVLRNESTEMPGIKRSRDGVEKKVSETSSSPFMPMFEIFRNELDEHHDRKERIVKASRDITAASKKM